MNVNARKIVRLAIVCGCFALAVKPSLAESPRAQVLAPTVNFYHPSCLTQSIASLKLGRDGVPRSASAVWWYVVVNFAEANQIGEGQHTHVCIRVGNGAEEKVAKLGNCETKEDVQIRRGIAYFNGGYIECEAINIGKAGRAIEIPVTGTLRLAKEFWMAAKGTMSSVVTDTVPLIRYEPITATLDGAVAVNLAPLSAGRADALVNVSVPRDGQSGPELTLGVKPSNEFRGFFIAQVGEDNLSYGWYLNSKPVFSETVPTSASFIPVWIGEGRFTIGGSPTGGPRFYGALDVVMFDPVSGGRGGG